MSVRFFKLPTGPSDQELDAWFSPGRFAALLALLILVMFPDVLLGGRTFILRDFGLFGYPLAQYFRDSFWRGEIPLWNPLSYCGLPFLAQWNTLVLYPGSLFYLLLPLEWSLGVFNLLHLFLCGLGMYWLTWNWTGSRRAATIAGLAFAFNGFTLNCLMWPNYIASLAWMPFVVLTVERAWRLGGRHLLTAALTGAMQMLSGTPEIILITWLLLGVFWALQLWQGEVNRLAVVFRAGLAVLLVTGLSAAQLLPFLGLLHFSQRESGQAVEEWAMPITGWANFLVPLFRMTQSSVGVFFQSDQRITSSYYCGIGVTALALLAAWHSRERRVRWLAVITAICLVLALGPKGWVYSALLKIFPPLGFMRFPIKFVMLPVFIVPLLAAYAVRDYLESPGEARARFWRSGLLVGVLFVVGIGLVIGFASARPGVDESWATTAMSGLTRAAFLLVTLGLWFVVGRNLGMRPKWGGVLALAVLTWLDLATHAPRQNPSVDQSVFRPGLPLHARLNPRPALGESRALLSLEAILAHRLKLLPNPANGHLIHRATLYANANLIDGLPKVDGFFALELPAERAVRYALYPTTNTCREALADFLSVSQFTAATNLLEWTARPTFMPMVTAGQEPVFLDETNTLAALLAPTFDPRATVLLRSADAALAGGAHRTRAQIKSSRWTAHQITVQVEAEAPCLVVFSQTYYEPWRAQVDGQAAPLLRANHAFQAVPVPAGQHEVVLRYQDRQFQLGAGISLLTLAGVVVGWRRKK